jgi:hypothetical protein
MKEVEEKVEKKVEKKDPRREAWDAYVESYRISNPVKYALKRATSVTQIGVDGKEYTVSKKDEFADIPASFPNPKKN